MQQRAQVRMKALVCVRVRVCVYSMRYNAPRCLRVVSSFISITCRRQDVAPAM